MLSQWCKGMQVLPLSLMFPRVIDMKILIPYTFSLSLLRQTSRFLLDEFTNKNAEEQSKEAEIEYNRRSSRSNPERLLL